jgi:hypothetical protein
MSVIKIDDFTVVCYRNRCGLVRLEVGLVGLCCWDSGAQDCPPQNTTLLFAKRRHRNRTINSSSTIQEQRKHPIHSSNQPTDMGRPSGVKNKKGHKAGGSKPKEKKLPRASTLAAMEVTRLTGLTSSS